MDLELVVSFSIAITKVKDISVISILCVVEDRPELSWQYVFKTERKMYLELLDIKANL